MNGVPSLFSKFSPAMPTIPAIGSSMAGYSGMAATPDYASAAAPSTGVVNSAALRSLAPINTTAAGPSVGGVGHSDVQSVQNVAPGAGVNPATPWSDLLGNIGTGVGIFKDLAGIWQGWQAQKLAKDQYKSSLAFANQNMANMVKDHNARRADVLHARGLTQNDDPAKTQAAIDSSMLNFKPIKG